MRTWRFWLGILCGVLLLASWPARGWAQAAEAEDEKTRVSLLFFGGPSKYKMSDVNRLIDENNQNLAPGFETKKVTGGFGYGAGIRVAPTRRLAIQFDYNRLPAKAKSSGLILPATPVEEEVAVPANALSLTGEVFRQWHGIHYGLGVGAGYYLCHGTVKETAGTQSIGYSVSGNGLGFHVLGLADIAISNSLHFDGGLGYRSAKSGNLQVNGNDLLLSDGSPVQADWSGITLRLGFSIPFNPGSYPTNQDR